VTSTERLAGNEKAAVLLLSIGTEAASDVLRHLGEAEVRKISQALARLRAIVPEQVRQVYHELEEKMGGNGLAVNGREFARTVVAKALADPASAAAPHRAEILADLEQLASSDGTGLRRVLENVPADILAKMLEGEHPQIAALILAHLGAAQGGAVLGHFPEDMQADLLERLARLDTVPAGLVAEVGAIFREQVKGLLRPSASALGGLKAVAEMMNHADKGLEERIFAELEKRDSALAESIRRLMFTFEDCIRLDNRSMQTLLKEVAREDLLLALKTASPALSEKIFANVSSRAAEILREDMASSGPVRLKDVEAAQLKIVAALRELEGDGRVIVAGSGKDDVIV
jgi:flagellar motor switch protein FliG